VFDAGADDLAAANDQRERITVLQIVMDEHPPAARHPIRAAEALLNGLEQGIVFGKIGSPLVVRFDWRRSHGRAADLKTRRGGQAKDAGDQHFYSHRFSSGMDLRNSSSTRAPSRGLVETPAFAGFSAWTALKRNNFTNAPTTRATSNCPR